MEIQLLLLIEKIILLHDIIKAYFINAKSGLQNKDAEFLKVLAAYFEVLYF